MSVITSLVQTQIQELKAQSLATMMSIVGGPAREDVGGATDKPVAARIIAMPEAGRMVLALPGGAVDVDIPPWLQNAAAKQPGLLMPGKSLPVIIDGQAGTIRLVFPEATAPAIARPAPEPAVKISVPPALPGTPAAVEMPLPRQSLFPAGTPGSAVEKLIGLRLPLPERTDAQALPGIRLKPGASTDGQRIAQVFSPALADLVLATALKQGPIAPALTALISALQDDLLPPEARQPAQSLMTNRLDATAGLKPEELAAALRKSGLMLEAQLLKAGSMPVSLDLKSALLTLKSMMSNPEAPVAPKDLLANIPPRSDAQHARLPSDLPRLIEGAIERITLQQVASLPDHHEMHVTDDRASGFRITTSLPLATQGLDRPQTAMIGLMLEHYPQGVPNHPGDVEDDQSSADREPFPWKVRIALDLEETGPVEAEIRLRAQTVSITLWAERKAMAASARDEIGQLHKALEAAQFDVSKLDVREGRPSGAPSRRMMALDRTS